MLCVLLAFFGCARTLEDTAVHTANGARQAEVAAGELLHERCTDAYLAAVHLPVESIRSRVAVLDRQCVPARKAYGVLRSARLALLAAIVTYQATGNRQPLASALARIAEAVASSSETVQRLEGP